MRRDNRTPTNGIDHMQRALRDGTYPVTVTENVCQRLSPTCAGPVKTFRTAGQIDTMSSMRMYSTFKPNPDRCWSKAPTDLVTYGYRRVESEHVARHVLFGLGELIL